MRETEEATRALGQKTAWLKTIGVCLTTALLSLALYTSGRHALELYQKAQGPEGMVQAAMGAAVPWCIAFTCYGLLNMMIIRWEPRKKRPAEREKRRENTRR